MLSPTLTEFFRKEKKEKKKERKFYKDNLILITLQVHMVSFAHKVGEKESMKCCDTLVQQSGSQTVEH